MSVSESDIIEAMDSGVALAKGVAASKGWYLHEVRTLMAAMANKGALVRVGPGYRVPREPDDAANGHAASVTLADIADRFTPKALYPPQERLKHGKRHDASVIIGALALVASVGRSEAALRAGVSIKTLDKWIRRDRDRASLEAKGFLPPRAKQSPAEPVVCVTVPRDSAVGMLRSEAQMNPHDSELQVKAALATPEFEADAGDLRGAAPETIVRQKIEAQLLAADDRAAFLRRMLTELDAL